MRENIGDLEFIYKSIDKDFYHGQMESRNPLRKWFHLNRYRIANSLVKSVYRQGQKIVDLGSGSCDWNINNLNVFGVDLNEDLLKVAQEHRRLYDYKVSSATDTGLPSNSFDIVTAFELLEHVKDYHGVIKESKRLLKEGGYCIISVPFDVFFSLWRPLFFIQVLFHGYILQDIYYKKRGGHINHFSIKAISEAFLRERFNIRRIFHIKRLIIFLCAQKTDDSTLPKTHGLPAISSPTIGR